MSNRYIPEPVKLRLWVNSGGMCALCGRLLVFEDAGKDVNIGEKAHIIPHSPGGPRKKDRKASGMTEEEINTADNLILLCRVCHKIVDNNEEKYPPDLLRKRKKEHEEWVLTRLRNVETSIAIIHKTHGPQVDTVILADKLNLKVLGKSSYQEQLDNLEHIDWNTARDKTIEVFEKAMAHFRKFEGVLFDVFPLSQIPLLIFLGSLITDTIPVRIFEYDRNKHNWVLNSPGDANVKDLGLKHITNLRNSKVLVVSLGVSSVISHGDIDKMVSLTASDLLEITVEEPEIDRVLFKEQVNEVRNYFKRHVELLHQEHRYQEIYLFYAGPAGLAVELGRAINRNMWPTVHLYHYNYRKEPRYERAFSI